MKVSPALKDRALLRRVLGLVGPYWFFVVSSLICAAVSVAAQLLVPILCGDAIDAMLGMGRVDFALVGRVAFAIALSTAIAAAAQWVLAACNNRIAFRVSRDLRLKAMAKLQRLPLAYLDRHPSGDLVSRMITDVDTFSDGLLLGFTQFFSGVLTIAGTLVLMARIHLGVTAVVVLLTPLSLFAAGFITRRTYRYFRDQTAIRGEQTALVEEQIQGQRVVQAFGHEQESLAAFDDVNDRLRDASVKAVFFSSLTNPVTRFVNSVVYAAVGLTGALLALGGGISVGQLSVFLSYANQYAKPFNEISGVVTELQNALACIQRVFDLLDAPDQIPDAAGAAVLEPDGRVKLENVSFSYVPERPLIEHFNLDVQPGQRIAAHSASPAMQKHSFSFFSVLSCRGVMSPPAEFPCARKLSRKLGAYQLQRKVQGRFRTAFGMGGAYGGTLLVRQKRQVQRTRNMRVGVFRRRTRVKERHALVAQAE